MLKLPCFLKWQSDIRDSSKGQIYNILKTEFGSEKYLINNLVPQNFRTIFIKFRTANHRLPINGVATKNLHVCNRGQIAYKYHYILQCNVFEMQRKKYSPKKY